MNEVLGLLDALEAAVLDGKKIPLSEKVMLDERQLLGLIDKIRIVVKSDGAAARQAIDKTPKAETIGPKVVKKSEEPSPKDLLDEANDAAKKITSGANIYADNVLANLQLMLTKMQKNLVTLEKNIRQGRGVLEDQKKNKKLTEKKETNDDNLNRTENQVA